MSIVDVKRSVQSFSKEPTPTRFKSDGSQNLAAGEFQKAFGDQALGDVLNKIADPNWVDPSKKMRTVGDSELGKDAFMKLMLAQMKHQDPTNPMHSHEMAAQLAQFTSLEQLTNINTTLSQMQNTQTPAVNYQALALIGKKVSGDSSKIVRVAGDTKHGISFELMGDAAKVNVTIKDSTGKPIRKLEFNNLKKGSNSVTWNGLSEDGMAARPGEYRVSIEASASNGEKVFTKTTFGGRITGLNFTPEGPVLLVGNQSIRLSEIKKIEDATPDEQIPQNVPAIPLKAGDMSKTETKQDDENIPPAEEVEVASNIDSIPMSGQLLSQIKSEVD